MRIACLSALLSILAALELDFDPRQTQTARWRCVHEHLAAALASLNHTERASPELIGNLTSCEELHLGSLTASDAAPLAEALSTAESGAATSLRVVNVDGSALLDSGMAALSQPLGGATRLSAIHAHNNRVGDEGAVALARALLNHPALGLLDLNGNFVGDIGADMIGHLLRVPAPPAVNAPLADLRLHDNLIGPLGAAALADALAYNTVLESLSLSGNPIGDDGAIAFANVLRHANRGLRRLYLFDAQVGAVGAQALLTMLTSPERAAVPRIEVLELAGNPAVPPALLAEVNAAVLARAASDGGGGDGGAGGGGDPMALSTATGVYREVGLGAGASAEV